MRTKRTLVRTMHDEPLELASFEAMSREDVRALASTLLGGEADAIESCVRFVCAETVNLWHGRGRAMMCRRLKHVPLDRDQRERLVACILTRLETGRFSEQFRDQLRLAVRLDRRRVEAAATRALESDRSHVKRYAQWTVASATRSDDAGDVT